VTIIIDPIALGLVASIARPGGNITGVTIAGGLEIIGKRMGLLVEAMPKLSTTGYLASRPFWKIQEVRQRESGQKGGVALSSGMLGALTRQSTSASSGRWNKIEWIRSWYLMNPEHGTYRATIVELAAKDRFPQFIRSANLSKLAD